jgi:hypothetical protein
MNHVSPVNLRIGRFYRFDHLDGEYRAAKLLKLGEGFRTAFVQFVGDDGSVTRVDLHLTIAYAELDVDDLKDEVIRLSTKIRVLAAEIHDLAAALGDQS